MEFTQATRTKTKARILLAGPKGSGKTMTSMYIAQSLLEADGMDEGIFVINTEIAGAGIGASSLYADQIPHVSGVIDYPFNPKDFVKGIDECIKAGAKCIIIDSATHEWEGVLNVVNDLELRSKNKASVWATATPLHDAFVQAVIGCPVHIIVTVRTEDKVGIDEKGKPYKIIDKYIARKGEAFGYEFSMVLHTEEGATNATVAKSRYLEVPVGKTYNLREGDMYKDISWAHNQGIEPPATKSAFVSMLRRFGYSTSEDMSKLKQELPALDQPWTEETHDEMMNALMDHHG